LYIRISYSISRKAKNFKFSGFFKLSSITLQSDSWGKQLAISRSRCCSHFILVIVGSVKEEDVSVVCGGKIIFLLFVVGGAMDAFEHLL